MRSFSQSRNREHLYLICETNIELAGWPSAPDTILGTGDIPGRKTHHVCPMRSASWWEREAQSNQMNTTSLMMMVLCGKEQGTEHICEKVMLELGHKRWTDVSQEVEGKSECIWEDPEVHSSMTPRAQTTSLQPSSSCKEGSLLPGSLLLRKGGTWWIRVSVPWQVLLTPEHLQMKQPCTIWKQEVHLYSKHPKDIWTFDSLPYYNHSVLSSYLQC